MEKEINISILSVLDYNDKKTKQDRREYSG